ncbi:mitochondrial carrier domain-containing protein [Zopfochytrium polystomum]|nr:mitochondrial carrier domain-containing protein [Zopfochytrium polystomum]
MADSMMGGAGGSVPVTIPALYPTHGGAPRNLGPVERFAISALSPAVAVIFTNPFDTAKVRLQLQKKSGAGEKVYKNTFDTLAKIFRNEGVKGLQKGLTPAVLREGSKNLFRIGMYDPIMSMMHDPSKGSAPPWKRMVAGSLCGVMGAFSCNPFELVKTRLQSQAAQASFAVGHQHQYKGVWDGLRDILRTDGVKGLYRGSVLSMGRSVVGSGTNLSSYSLIKEYLIVQRRWQDSWVMDMIAGLGSGVVACVFMNPIDVVRTRYYNQPYENGKGLFYSSGFDAAVKITRNEGMAGFYKGLFTHFLRIGPHFCLTFVFLGVFRRQLLHAYEFLDMRDSFKSFDKNGDGKLDSDELSSVIRQVIPPGNAKTSDYEEMIDNYAHRILDKADQDHDHAISFKEYSMMTEEVKAIYIERQREAASNPSNISQRSMKSFA